MSKNSNKLKNGYKMVTLMNPQGFWGIYVKGIKEKEVPEKVNVYNFDGSAFIPFYWHSYNHSSFCIESDYKEYIPLLNFEMPEGAFLLVSMSIN